MCERCAWRAALDGRAVGRVRLTPADTVYALHLSHSVACAALSSAAEDAKAKIVADAEPAPRAEAGDSPTAAIGTTFGYLEMWNAFSVRSPYHLSNVWSVASLPAQGGIAPGVRRATVALSEVLLPRTTAIRTLNMPVTAIPFLWCYVRHRMMRPLADQSVVIHRLFDPDRPLDPHMRPPAWVEQRDALRFQLTIPSAKIPGESRFIGQGSLRASGGNPVVGCASSNTVTVEVVDAVGAGLPEFCLVLPSGEVLDFVQYGDAIVLPREVIHDEYAGISVLLTVQFDEAPVKRFRTSAVR